MSKPQLVSCAQAVVSEYLTVEQKMGGFGGTTGLAYPTQVYQTTKHQAKDFHTNVKKLFLKAPTWQIMNNLFKEA